jgi:hypothetical protein
MHADHWAVRAWLAVALTALAGLLTTVVPITLQAT